VLKEKIHLGVTVSKVHKRRDGRFEVRDDMGNSRGVFDDVILATHADTSAELLAHMPINPVLRWLLRQIEYTSVGAYLHSDSSFLPSEERWRAMYNLKYTSPPPGEASQMEMTGRMQHIFGYGNAKPELLLTVGNLSAIAGPVYKKFWWSHMTFDLWHMILITAVLPHLNGRSHLHFAGAWTLAVGHNDGVISGVRAACAVGLPAVANKTFANAAEQSAYETLIKRPKVQNVCGNLQ